MLGPYPPFRAALDVFTAAYYAWSVALQQEAFRTFGSDDRGSDDRAGPRISHRQPGKAERRDGNREARAPAPPRPGHAERPVTLLGKRCQGGAGLRARPHPEQRAEADRHRSV